MKKIIIIQLILIIWASVSFAYSWGNIPLGEQRQQVFSVTACNPELTSIECIVANPFSEYIIKATGKTILYQFTGIEPTATLHTIIQELDYNPNNPLVKQYALFVRKYNDLYGNGQTQENWAKGYRKYTKTKKKRSQAFKQGHLYFTTGWITYNKTIILSAYWGLKDQQLMYTITYTGERTL